MSNPVVQLYRSIHFDYETGLTMSSKADVCKCPCSKESDKDCRGLDALVHGGSSYLFTDHPDGNCPTNDKDDRCSSKHQDNAMRKRCPKACNVINEPEKYNTKRNSHPCVICRDITVAISQMFDRDDVNPQFLQLEGAAFQSLQAGADAYKKAKANGEASIRQAIADLEQKRAHFEAQASKIRALKDKVRVATEVLHEATGKLGGMGASFNTLEQQNGLQYKDRVPVGIPYFPPFFTLSNRNFVVMMVCINVLLLVGIIVYAFVGRIRTDADVVATRGTAVTGESDRGNKTGASSVTAPAPASAAPTPPPSAPEATKATESSSTFDEPEAAPSESASAAASGSSEDTASSSASSDDASTGRARGGRRRSSLSAGRRYAD